MKANCESLIEEIVAFAADARGLSTEAAEHVGNCTRCREKVAELKAIAALHREAAAQLAEPKRRLGRAKLEAAMTKGGSSQSHFEIPWRPMLAGALALGVMVGVIVIHRMPRESLDASFQVKPQPQERQVRPVALEPTLLALHREVEGGRERMLAGNTGAGIRHYRVKDAAGELRN